MANGLKARYMRQVRASSCHCACMDSSRSFPQMDVAVHRFAELLQTAIFAGSVADPVDARPGDVRWGSEVRSVARELHDVIAHGCSGDGRASGCRGTAGQ